VTDRRHAERSLAEQAAQLQERSKLLDLADDAILVRAVPSGEIRFWNRGAERLYGYTQSEALGAVSHELLQTQFPRPIADIESELQQFGSWRGEIGHTCKNGEKIIVDSRWTIERSDDGEPRAYLELNTDITARRQTDDALRKLTAKLSRSNAELEQFTHIASHDLQEPLRMVSSYTQLLARRYQGKLDQDADEFIAYAVDGANRMQRLIEDLLSYARVGSHGRELEDVELDSVVERVLDDLRSSLKESGGSVQVAKLPVVLGDAGSLTQLFQNLIGNALKYRGEELPHIDVTASSQDHHWEVSVRDNGIGFEQEYADQLFNMFKRLHTRDQYDGTGIGLAICKKIVERHGGHIWAESQPGQGAKFVFTLPAQR
jgi:PAS domain S-box-containing protein